MTASFALNTNNVARGQVTTPAMETQIYPPQWFRNNFRGPQYSDGWQYMGAGGPNLAIRQPGTWPMKFPPGTVMTSATTLQTMAWLNDAYARGMMVNGCDPPVYFGGDPVYVAQGIPCGTPYPMPPQGTYPAPLPVPEPSPVPAPPGGFPLGVPPGGKPPGKRPPLPTPKPGSSFTPMPFAGIPGPKPGSKRPPRPVPPRPSAPAIPPSFSSGPSPRRPNPGVPDMRRTFVPMPAATRSQRPQCPPGTVYSPLEQRCKRAGLTSRTVTRRANKPGGGPSSCPPGMYKKCIENSYTHGCLKWVCVPYAPIPPITSKPKPVTRVPARAVPMKRLGTVTRRANKTGVNTCPPCYPGSVAKCLQYDYKTLDCVKCSCEPTITSRPRPTLISPVPSVRAMKRLGTVTRRANAECKPARGEKASPGKIWSTEKCTWVNQKISLPDPSDRDPLGGLDPITRVPTRAVPIKRIGVATTRPGPMPLPRDVPRMTAMTRTANQPAASGFSPGTCFDKSTGMVRLPNGRVVKPSSVKVTATMAYVKVGSTSGTVPLCGASSRPAVSTTIASPRRTHRVPVGR